MRTMSTNPATTTPNDADASTSLPPYQQNNTSTNSSPMDLTTRLPLLSNAGEVPIDFAGSEPINISMIDSMPPQHTNNLIGSPPGSGGNSLTSGMSLMHSSPPPHSYRHSRSYRHFKNPPQPHMCIRTTTESGEELFINVLSWTRIVIPQEPSDPIPLYGGMRVPPGSPRSPPIVFAVMANPEVLKDSGRHSKDPEERRAMVELMCDFVEAMNPGVKLVRNAVILKDRDISGELKDVWNAVQAQRDREREEQMMQQRQQQHYHNITTQQMFPKSQEALSAAMHEQQLYDGEGGAQSMGVDQESLASGSATMMQPYTQQEDNRTTNIDGQLQEQSVNTDESNLVTNTSNSNNHSSSNESSYSLDTTDNALNRSNISAENTSDVENKRNGTTFSTQQNGFDHKDPTEALATKDETKVKGSKSNIKITHNNTNSNASQNSKKDISHISTATTTTTTNTANTAGQSKRVTTPTSPTLPILANATTSAGATTTSISSTSNASNATTPPTTTTITSTTTKKEKLGGFLPNGCIFPRFKNNKHKDKDKEKEPKTKDKEKTLLNALKKSKDKKVAPIEQPEKATTESDTVKTQYEKNCINLENEVQKLDLNKIDIASNTDSMFIKLKVTNNSSTAAK